MISNKIVKASYSGNGVTRQWGIPFAYTDASQICVALLEDDVQTILDSNDFTVNTGSGVVVYPKSNDDDPIAAGVVLVVFRDTDITQLSDLTNQGGAWPETIEASLDKLTLIAQEQNEKLGRAVLSDITGGTTAEEMIEQIHEDRLATHQDMLTTKGYKEDVAADLALSISARDTTISYAGDAEGYKDQAHHYMTVAQNNANAAQNAATAAQGYAQSASDSADQAVNASEGSEHWAQLAYEYTDPLRHALGNMFEYDANGDVQLVEDPLTGTDPSWELDTNNDVMPVA
ncbi:hypothetical protein [Anaerovibrio sp. RM50]|uniref:hypothetical protein n=1 Tax=Anaerovibrio sp. RM50 TaxID=1200557 RepID=UPI000486A8EA|nr:hypothetical protein [Anaerovibrio sp. RM50]